MNRTPMSESYLNSQAGKEQNRQVAQPASQHQPQSGGSQQGEDFQPISGSSSNPRASSSATNNPNQNPNQNQNQSQQQRPPIPQLMCATELTNLLLEFAFSVFVNKPDDIVEYAASYFNQLRGQRPQGQAQLTEWLGAGKRASNDSQKSYSSTSSNDHQANIINTNANNNINTTGQTNECLEDDFEYEPLGRMVSNSNVQPKLSFNRRKSVFAEHYDPANDLEEDENNRVIHGKTDEQRQRLAKAIKSIFIFRSVDPQDVTNILDAMFEVKVSAGDVVIRQGDDGDNFYVVERGKFQIYVTLDDGTRQVRGEYEDNGSFGELALMYNQPRAATVIALSDGSLWAMDRNTFRRIVLKSAFKKRKEYEALFEKVSVLQCLNGYERMNLCDALESRRFSNGQMIISQGDQANGMYFIESGNVKIVKQVDDGRVIEVAILGKGDYFGELALINHKPRAASVYAMGDDVKLAFLDVKAFERLLGSCIDRMEQNCALYLKELSHDDGRQNV